MSGHCEEDGRDVGGGHLRKRVRVSKDGLGDFGSFEKPEVVVAGRSGSPLAHTRGVDAGGAAERTSVSVPGEHLAVAVDADRVPLAREWVTFGTAPATKLDVAYWTRVFFCVFF